MSCLLNFPFLELDIGNINNLLSSFCFCYLPSELVCNFFVYNYLSQAKSLSWHTFLLFYSSSHEILPTLTLPKKGKKNKEPWVCFSFLRTTGSTCWPTLQSPHWSWHLAQSTLCPAWIVRVRLRWSRQNAVTLAGNGDSPGAEGRSLIT